MKTNPTPHQDVNEILDLLLTEAKDVLGNQFVGMYLYGSLSSGDFDPKSSDIDFLIIGKNQKRALKTEFFESKEFETDINIVCRSPNFFEQSLSRGNPVDLIALKYGEILYDNGYFKELKKKKACKPSAKTIQSWMRTGLHR